MDEASTKFSLTFEDRKSYAHSEIPNDRSESPPLYKEDRLSEHNSETDYLEDDSLPCPYSMKHENGNGCGEAKIDVNTPSSTTEEKEELPISPNKPRTPPRVGQRKRPVCRSESPAFDSSYHLKFTPTMSHRKLVDMQRSSSQSISRSISASRSRSFLRSDSGLYPPPPLSPTSPQGHRMNDGDLNQRMHSDLYVDVDSPFTIHTKRSLSYSAENYAKYMMPTAIEGLKECEKKLDEDMKEAEEERKREEEEMDGLEELGDVDDESMIKMIKLNNIKNNNRSMSKGGENEGENVIKHTECDEKGRKIPFPLNDDNPETLREYILNPLPSETGILKCCITREKHFSGNVYHVNLDYPNDHTYLLSCKKRMNAKTSYYAISTSETDFIEPHYRLGKNPTYYSIYSNGKNPNRTENKELVRDEMGIVLYNNPHDNPPDVFAIIPFVKDNKAEVITDSNNGTLYTRICNNHYNDFIILRSRKPIWSPQLHGHIMPFGGRVTKPSTKNFQLLQAPYGNETILQFGRTGDDTFIFDLKHPLSIYQGLAIIMSVIDQGINDKNTDALVDRLAELYPAPTHL